MNHVSVSPTDGNGPTQGQRKTLTRVGIEHDIERTASSLQALRTLKIITPKKRISSRKRLGDSS